MLSLRIALRYLLSHKSHGAVNVISAVAIAGVAVAAAAMIIVLSVFNGFTQLVEKKTSSFNPPLLVLPVAAHTIANADSLADALATTPGVALAAPLIDEQAFAISAHGQMPVNIRALPPRAIAASGLPSILLVSAPASGPAEAAPAQEATAAPASAASEAAFLSVGAALTLNAHPADTIGLFEPRRLGRVNPANPMKAFRGAQLRVQGVYQVEQEEQDRDMLVVPLSVARRLLDYTTEATGIAIYLTSDSPSLLASTRSALADRLPAGYRVADRIEQEADAHRMIALEKWITFLMLLFILAISSFNIISTLSLMVVEKQANMAVFSAIGAPNRLIRAIFANQGWLITLLGGIVGLLIGSLITLGQQTFGWVKIQASNPAVMAIDYYPVQLQATDILIILAAILLTATIISAVASTLPRSSMRKKLDITGK
ncbi:MAG: FtsX-like permease family protein [Muribaculaceae bacterium]|nr:FtsX-like permease family protein [Muribaculaceae bacterium]